MGNNCSCFVTVRCDTGCRTAFGEADKLVDVVSRQRWVDIFMPAHSAGAVHAHHLCWPLPRPSCPRGGSVGNVGVFGWPCLHVVDSGVDACLVCESFMGEVVERPSPMPSCLALSLHLPVPRYARRSCGSEPRLLLDHLGILEFLPCFTVCAVVEYVTKYAAKACDDVLVDQRSVSRVSYIGSSGDREFGIVEAVHLGLGLPLCLPLLPTVPLNTFGTRLVKPSWVIRNQGADEALTYDSRIDRFDKLLDGVLVEQRPASDGLYIGSTGFGVVVCSLAPLSLAFVLVD